MKYLSQSKSFWAWFLPNLKLGKIREFLLFNSSYPSPSHLWPSPPLPQTYLTEQQAAPKLHCLAAVLPLFRGFLVCSRAVRNLWATSWHIATIPGSSSSMAWKKLPTSMMQSYSIVDHGTQHCTRRSWQQNATQRPLSQEVSAGLSSGYNNFIREFWRNGNFFIKKTPNYVALNVAERQVVKREKCLRIQFQQEYNIFKLNLKYSFFSLS